MVSDALRQDYRRSTWMLVVRGLIALALGIFIIARPLESVAAFALVIALWAIISGIIQIVHAFDMRLVVAHWWLLLLAGIVSLAFGVAALYYYPVLSLAFAVIWFAYWLLVTGFFAIYAGVQEQRLGLPWGWTLALGVLSVVAGVYAIIAPPVTLTVIMGLVAGFAIVSGAFLLIGAYRLRSLRSDVLAATAPATP